MSNRYISLENRSPFLVRTVRGHAQLYSSICKARLMYSRYIAGSSGRTLFQKHRDLFSMNESEAQHCQELRDDGFTVIHELFATDLVNRVQAKAEDLFRARQLDFLHAYSVQRKQRSTLEGLSYEELESSEKFISLKDPLLNIPECVDIAFHESLIRIAGNFLGYVPSTYDVDLVRDFPHNRPLESSNFHKDNDEADSLQIFVYLVDVDDKTGPLVYVPGSNQYDVRSCRPRLSRDLGIDQNDGRLSDAEVEKYYPRESWAVLKVKRGSVAFIHGNGIHKGPWWAKFGDSDNEARTAFRIDINGAKRGTSYREKGNKISPKCFDRLSKIQKLFAHRIV